MKCQKASSLQGAMKLLTKDKLPITEELPATEELTATEMLTTTENKPKKRKRDYDRALIPCAFKAVREEGMSVYKAARVFGIPESTLRDRHLGMQPVDHLPSSGPCPLLTREEEKILIDHFIHMSSIGYGYSTQEFLDIAFEFAVVLEKKLPEEPRFRLSWFDRIKKRWPDTDLAKFKQQRKTSASATSEESLDKHFAALRETYKQLGLDEHPERIWNVDETEIEIENRPSNILSPKRSIPDVDTSPKKFATIIGCGNAAGSSIPPYYIFPGKKWNDDYLEHTCPGSAGDMTESGCTNAAAFQRYLEQHFLKYVAVQEGKNHLIIFDSHPSHVALSLINWGEDHGITFYTLPPYTSHVTQPVDVACFGPLKAFYQSESHAWKRDHPKCKISKNVFGELSSKAYPKAFSPANLVNAFKETGVYPVKTDVGYLL